MAPLAPRSMTTVRFFFSSRIFDSVDLLRAALPAGGLTWRMMTLMESSSPVAEALLTVPGSRTDPFQFDVPILSPKTGAQGPFLRPRAGWVTK